MYEYDHIFCHGAEPERSDGFSLTEFSADGKRTILELWRYEQGQTAASSPGTPNRSELYAEPAFFDDSDAMNTFLANCCVSAYDAGAQELQLLYMVI